MNIIQKLISFIWYDSDDVQHSELVEEQDYVPIESMPSVSVDTALGLGGRVVSSGVPEVLDRDTLPSHKIRGNR